ncbi:hypothetical protein M8C21_028276 [Ambrosia artemisiifolia]|uniref:Uncharacterized protein n=1 Tax=Ambrosia artemisiifolia TaxID=4212 RepID=A0AAD5G3Y3_AMBAR|nr:hypothetical protein M8C21_028276 [Ambrosia artemisiifolia]
MRAAKNMTNAFKEEEFEQLKRGPWTLEEDNLLIHYVNRHGEGRWNSLAKLAGLKRTGKSCRLRWLNYLKPDIKRGNLTPQEQLAIHELHLKWGNRWSKIARHLPGRTDNEIKNYWRTRVQKQARHLKIDSSSKRFIEALQRFWMPRLLEKVEQTSSSSSSSTSTLTTETDQKRISPKYPQAEPDIFTELTPTEPNNKDYNNSTSNTCASDSCGNKLPQLPEMSQLYEDTAYYNSSLQNFDNYNVHISEFNMMGFGQPDDHISTMNFQVADTYGLSSDDMATDTYWNMEDLW